MELLNGNSLKPSDCVSSSPSKLSVLVVGGSVGGLSCAHGLLRAGCSVFVFEKARSVAPLQLGAGLVLDEVECCPALREWGFGDALLQHAIPLAVEENRAVERKTKSLHTLVVNPLHNTKALHWNDLHKFLYDALPKGIVRWGHEVVAFQEIKDGKKVMVVVRQIETGSTIEVEGDVLVAADGCNSRIRAHFLPEERRRYLGYSAWRGVLDKSAEGSKELLMAMSERYPKLGNTVYIEMTGDSHSAVFEIPGGRLNWLWYVNQPEPTFKGSSLTRRAGEEAIAKMVAAAEEELTPEMAGLIRATPSPFLQAICDKEPLKKMVWGRVVLLGEAAHPTTPHAARSTNMSIMDAVTLSKCLSAIIGKDSGVSAAASSTAATSTPVSSWNGEGSAKTSVDIEEGDLFAALRRYEGLRLPATTQQLLFSRFLGQLKQGHLHGNQFSWLHASCEDRARLVQAQWHAFDPSTVASSFPT